MEVASLDIAALITATAPIIVAVIDSRKKEPEEDDKNKNHTSKVVHVFALYLLIYALAGLLTAGLLAYSSITGAQSNWGGVNIIWTTAYLSMVAIMYTNFFRRRA